MGMALDIPASVRLNCLACAIKRVNPGEFVLVRRMKNGGTKRHLRLKQ
jgi:hypothetical protein